jgi:hypothetical protein
VSKLGRASWRAPARFHGWHPIAFELRFEDGFEDAREWPYAPNTQDELDRICQAARTSKGEAA